jgi:hypothetical protein
VENIIKRIMFPWCQGGLAGGPQRPLSEELPETEEEVLVAVSILSSNQNYFK